ncbi:GDP-mannose 4,6-dehydratase [Arsenicibacter rosenii]|uniref:GDP-mannose 4,6-dehydratase n=1 Tax=Arsenicibacter rosenii TaxID=1750698 RepID=A0A1S2VCS9_9BACT|nr:GDP-mannose 4,6-dehydratase [Arsenicibacter rosenii]OIN56514.1 GDP-mannose 4,6-dehydratase [Arsenicibacter rosenii]
MNKALICGVSGQDGAYLAQLLLKKGYDVYGGSRDAQMSSFTNLVRLGIKNDIRLVSLSINDFRSVLQTILRIKPDEIYNLAGQSSVGLSFEQPVETLESISVGTLNLLEAIRFSELPIRFYNAGSSECFGDTGQLAADETTPFRPRSPYGVAKAAAYWQVANYREAYQIHASTGILFNHESPLRPERFVTQKIVATACRIAKGSKETLTLGNIDIARDWGWAPDYVEAMWLMLQQDIVNAGDYVIATGKTNKLKDFIEAVFTSLDLNWEQYIDIDQSLFRPTDIAEGHANPVKAKRQLNWEARYSMQDVAREMVEARM